VYRHKFISKTVVLSRVLWRRYQSG